MTVVPAALVVNSPAERGLHPDGAPVDPHADRKAGEQPRISVGAVLSDPTFWLAAFTFAVVLSGMKGMITNLAPLAIDAGVKADKAALLISVYAGGGLIAKLGFAALADRLGPRPLMFVSLTGFAVGMSFLTRASAGYAVIAMGVGLIGLFGGLMVPLQSFLIPRIFGQRVVGRAMGLISMVTLCALLSTPPIFGLIFDLTGNYNGIFYAFAALAAATLAVVPLIRLHPRPVRVDEAPLPAE
jgi:MFS family permease